MKNVFSEYEHARIGDPGYYSYSFIDGILSKYDDDGFNYEVPLDEASDELILEALSYFHHSDFNAHQEPFKTPRDHLLACFSRFD